MNEQTDGKTDKYTVRLIDKISCRRDARSHVTAKKKRRKKRRERKEANDFCLSPQLVFRLVSHLFLGSILTCRTDGNVLTSAVHGLNFCLFRVAYHKVVYWVLSCF